MATKAPRPGSDELRQKRALEKAALYRAFKKSIEFIRSLEPIGRATYQSNLGPAARAAVIEAMLPAEQWIRANWHQEEDTDG